MLIAPLIQVKAELTDGGLPPEPIVLSTRIRLARNIVPFPFPGWASPAQRAEALRICTDALRTLDAFKGGTCLEMEQLSALEKQILVERHLISRELCEAETGAGAVISRDQKFAVMINEEDHLRIQAVRTGFNLDKTWQEINALDSAIEGVLDYAFSRQFGYLTACPTNLGTGLRASAMLHLPGLVFQEHMEKVVRMVNQIGMAVRGLFGEGSEATGSIFQISNQQTLGENEAAILKRLNNVLLAIMEQERNSRQVILEQHADKLFDRIGRAYGILRNAHVLSSEEAMNLLSLMRLAVDLGMLPENFRSQVDRLFIESQPGHVQFTAKAEIDPVGRDRLRARKMREEFAALPTLDFNTHDNRGSGR